MRRACPCRSPGHMFHISISSRPVEVRSHLFAIGHHSLSVPFPNGSGVDLQYIKGIYEGVEFLPFPAVKTHSKALAFRYVEVQESWPHYRRSET